MTLSIAGVENLFECDSRDYINTLVVENPSFLYDILMDINNQFAGNEGRTVVSETDKVLPLEKYTELIAQFVPFNINQKSLVNKLIARICDVAVDSDHFMQTTELMTSIEQYCMGLCLNLSGNIDFTKITSDNIIKASGVEFVDDYDSLSEKLLDYFELVREYDKEKVFILFNIRSVMSTDELQMFVDEILKRGFQVLLLDSTEYTILDKEKRVIIDKSLCEIC